MIDTGDTAFILICTALVFLMTPGLAFFYGGMVRRKNVLNTMFMSFMVCGLISVLWVVCGYSLAFGGDGGSIIGGLDKLLLNGVAIDSVSGTIPELLFMAFQMMFALITIAILTGSLAGRIRFSRLMIILGLWMIFVYAPLAHMVWGGGIINQIGAIDFAGGDVVHISSGVAGLVIALMIGKRRDHGLVTYKPHNIPFVALGTGLLWFGWFGFNAGSALGANGLAAHAFVTTNTAAAMAMLSWMLVERLTNGKPTLLGACTGAVVGLVVITPGAGYVPIWASIIMGALVSPVCFFAVSKVKAKFGYDDALDAFGCHGVGGILGGILTGVFAQASIGGFDGLLAGNPGLLLSQIEGIVITIVYVVVVTFVITKVVQLIGGDLRVTPAEEADGLDISQHSESAYPAFTGLD